LLPLVVAVAVAVVRMFLVVQEEVQGAVVV
jgi:hypothetical protein